MEELLDGGGGTGAVPCVLEQDGITENQIWGNKAGNLVIRVVPRHNTD